MRLRMVYIKRAGGEIASEACYAAYKGFMAMGYSLNFFEHDDLKHQRLRLDALTLLVGGTHSVHSALEQIGVTPPRPLNVPESLRRFADRNIWQTQLGKIRLTPAFPVFVKPLIDTKAFKGTVLRSVDDLQSLEHLTDETQIEAASVITLKSEWRYFVQNRKVVGLAHYSGECASFPEFSIVEEAVDAYSNSPIAYALDFGVTENGKTVLIEANDAFAIGSHGLDAIVYARFLESRWLELTADQRHNN